MGIFRQKGVKKPVFARVCQNARPCRGTTRFDVDKLCPGRSLSSKALVGDRGSTRFAGKAKLGPGRSLSSKALVGDRGSTRCASAGFTLLEILVAFTLLALAMGIIMQIFSRGVNGADLADRYAKAAMLAESRLASIGVEEVLSEGDTSGQFNDDYGWSMSVRPYLSANEPATPSTLETTALANAQATGAGGTSASTLAPTAPTTTLGNVDIDSLLPVRLYEIELSVTFRTDDGRQRVVTLNTMKIGPRI
jgi:type II secretory pathway pseudopilin PulG